MGITRAVDARGRRLRRDKRVPTRTVSAAAAALLCGGFGVGVLSLSGTPSGAATTAILYADNVNGTQTAGCGSAGSGACKTIQEGVTAAQALSGTAVTLNVAGSTTTYAESVTINLTTASGDSLISRAPVPRSPPSTTAERGATSPSPPRAWEPSRSVT